MKKSTLWLLWHCELRTCIVPYALTWVLELAHFFSGFWWYLDFLILIITYVCIYVSLLIIHNLFSLHHFCLLLTFYESVSLCVPFFFCCNFINPFFFENLRYVNHGTGNLMWFFIWSITRRQKEDALNFRVKKENEVSASEKVGC